MKSLQFKSMVALALTCVLQLPASADVLIFGGTRGVGLETVRQLREAGEGVTVMVRKTSDLTALNAIEGVKTTVGDALDMDSVTAAFASGQFDAAVSTLGGLPGNAAVDSTGNINAIDAAQAAGVPRFILVTSIGAGDSRAAAPAAMKKVLGEVIAGKEQAERRLIDSDLSWTIIRPGLLTNKPASGNGILTQNTSDVGLIPRAEVARLIVQALGNGATFKHVFSALEKKP